MIFIIVFFSIVFKNLGEAGRERSLEAGKQALKPRERHSYYSKKEIPNAPPWLSTANILKKS